MRRARRIWLLVIVALAGCKKPDDDHDVDAGPSDGDPLDVTVQPPPGSLDDLHARIIEKRCSGQPGLCHNGQFEPNLSTPGLTYAYLVNRPAIEKPGLLRVRPGSAAQSVFIDKIRGRNGVLTRMPLGAEPLDEPDVAALEAWIDGGALRAPGAAPAPVLNNPPRRPQIAIYNSAGTRLDGAGPVTVAPNTTLVLRHSVQDFETGDASVPFAAVIVQAPDGRNVVLATGQDPHIGPTTYDPAGPMGQGDQLNWKRSWTIGSSVELYNEATKEREIVDASGIAFRVLAVYVDGNTPGMLALDIARSTIGIP